MSWYRGTLPSTAVHEIREWHAQLKAFPTFKDVARRYGLSVPQVVNIVRGVSYRHVK